MRCTLPANLVVVTKELHVNYTTNKLIKKYATKLTKLFEFFDFEFIIINIHSFTCVHTCGTGTYMVYVFILVYIVYMYRTCRPDTEYFEVAEMFDSKIDFKHLYTVYRSRW